MNPLARMILICALLLFWAFGTLMLGLVALQLLRLKAERSPTGTLAALKTSTRLS